VLRPANRDLAELLGKGKRPRGAGIGPVTGVVTAVVHGHHRPASEQGRVVGTKQAFDFGLRLQRQGDRVADDKDLGASADRLRYQDRHVIRLLRQRHDLNGDGLLRRRHRYVDQVSSAVDVGQARVRRSLVCKLLAELSQLRSRHTASGTRSNEATARLASQGSRQQQRVASGIGVPL